MQKLVMEVNCGWDYDEYVVFEYSSLEEFYYLLDDAAEEAVKLLTADKMAQKQFFVGPLKFTEWQLVREDSVPTSRRNSKTIFVKRDFEYYLWTLDEWFDEMKSYGSDYRIAEDE